MTYSLNTFNSSTSEAGLARTGLIRFANEIGLFLGFVILALWVMALLTYSPQDPAWSTSGTVAAPLNLVGHLGAWMADASYFLFGFSVWWCVAAGVRVWLSTLARWLRGHTLRAIEVPENALTGEARLRRQAAFWSGLALLLGGSVVLEWSRFYSLEAQLPGHVGGVLGFWLGPLGVHWLGFVGSALAAIVAGVAGSALVFRFSWGQLAERLGAWLYSKIENRREQLELAQDLSLGQEAARAREEVLVEVVAEALLAHLAIRVRALASAWNLIPRSRGSRSPFSSTHPDGTGRAPGLH